MFQTNPTAHSSSSSTATTTTMSSADNLQERANQAAGIATREGAIHGLLTLIPSTAAVYMATRNWPAFARRTNVQSRTALAIMPAFFIFALTSEQRLNQRVKEVYHEKEHVQATVQWAEEQHEQQQKQRVQQQVQVLSGPQAEMQLTRLYQQSIDETGYQIVPRLHWYHHTANYVANHPIKVLAAVAIPSVAWIFYGRNGQDHLQFSVKLLHTRVFGQFATISILLSVMGFKDFMDRHGRFMAQDEADHRVQEMHRVRQALLDRIAHDRQEQQARQLEIQQAHEEDVLLNNHKKGKKKNKNGQAKNDVTDLETTTVEQH